MDNVLSKIKAAKRKRIPFPYLVLLLIGFSFFNREVIGPIRGTKTFVPYKLLFNKPETAKDIEIITYKFADAHLKNIYLNPNAEITQPSEEEIGDKNLNIIFKISNNVAGKGVLAFGLCTATQKINVNLDNSDEKHKIYIIPKGWSLYKNIKDLPIKTEWLEFYPKKQPKKSMATGKTTGNS